MTTDEANDEPIASPAEPVRLWLPRFILFSSAFLGYPGGLGLAARNAWRIGQRSKAWLFLVVGAFGTAVFVFLTPDDLPRFVSIGLNAGVAGALYSIVLGQVETVESAGGQVVRASNRSGIATFLGGWLVTGGPTILIILVPGFLGGQTQAALAGTVVFGTSGSGCDVTKAALISSGDRMYWVAYLSREARDGEILRISERAPGVPDTPKELVVSGSADCISSDGFAFALPTETITVEVTIGSERLAYGWVTVLSR